MKKLKLRLKAFKMTVSKERPWTDPISSTDVYDIYIDKFPVTEGHLLFVPKVDTTNGVLNCLDTAYYYGLTMVKENKWDGFNIGLNYGSTAGQTCDWSHVHLIPRYKGDVEDPTGGVRGVIPERQNYKKGKLYGN